ncbi:MAG: EFR1 family ferrodoxin [Deltaproteobacteria bacterium]|nr:EFR1 family ferrodoxin [Candidatus Zymogenaceae bacterium]
MTAHSIRTASVMYYSQTGHTKQYARYIASILERNGLAVHTFDMLTKNPKDIPRSDIIIVGTPVFYYDVPGNAIDWLRRLPDIEGVFGAAFATYGGEGGNQHNTACTTLNLLTERGALPVALATFGNMSTFAPTWSLGNERRTLAYTHLPNEETYRRVADFTHETLDRAGRNEIVRPKKRPSFSNMIRGRLSMRGTKLFITGHRIDGDRCIDCGLCERSCPVAAVDVKEFSIDTKRCIACFGCVNNCPEGAVQMKFLGRQVSGLTDFRKKHSLVVNTPLA